MPLSSRQCVVIFSFSPCGVETQRFDKASCKQLSGNFSRTGRICLGKKKAGIMSCRPVHGGTAALPPCPETPSSVGLKCFTGCFTIRVDVDMMPSAASVVTAPSG